MASNLLKVRLLKQHTENKEACMPLGKAAKPASKHHGFWETILIHSGFIPQACELRKHIQLAVNWGYYVWPLTSSSPQKTYLY